MKKSASLKLKRSIAVMIMMIASVASVSKAANSEDPILNTLPDNCMFCLRINNINDTLGKVDTYLAGALPVPTSLTMLVNMQLISITGDPAMTGIDLTKDFAVFAIPPMPDQTEPIIGLLVPVKDYNEFVKTNPNCTPAENGSTLLSSADSPLGKLMLAPAGDNLALVVPEFHKATLPVLQKALSENPSKMSGRLNSAQIKEAAAPVWAYINIADLYAKYKDQLTGMLQMARAGAASEAPPAVAGMMEFYFKVLPELLNTFAGGADAVTLALEPKPDILNIDTTFWAKDGSELAKTLIKNPDTSGFTMTGSLDDKNAVNGLMKLNGESSKQMYDLFFDSLAKAMEDPEFKDSLDQFKASLDKYCDSMGKEMAMSFSYVAGVPPFQFYEIVDVKSPDLMKEYMQESMGFVGDMYKAMGLPMEFKYDPAVSTYKNATLGTLSITFSMPSDPNDEMGEELNVMMEKMYGKDGLKYYTAQTPDKFYMVMGADGETALKALIDKPAAVASGDFKIALDTLKDTPYTDAVISINIIKLLKGIGGMMQTMQETMCEEADEMKGPAAMFASLQDTPTQSCMVFGGKVSDGHAGMRLAMPKQHLIEIIAMGLQMQQQMMQQQQQMQMQDQGALGTTPLPAPQMSAQESVKSSLPEWIGKPAPDLKMVDLQGNVQRISRLKGKKIMLDFWATWCPPCKETIPELIKIRSDTKETELAVFGLSDEPVDRLNEYAKEAKMNYPVIAYNEDLPAPYNEVNALPTLFLIDSEGIIKDILIGYQKGDVVRDQLNKLE